MDVQGIRDLILSVDSEARHYEAALDGSNFTVWMEYERILFFADDDSVEKGWKFEIDRYTKDEYDPIADALETMLLSTDGITSSPRRVQYNQETGYIRHIFDCEAV